MDEQTFKNNLKKYSQKRLDAGQSLDEVQGWVDSKKDEYRQKYKTSQNNDSFRMLSSDSQQDFKEPIVPENNLFDAVVDTAKYTYGVGGRLVGNTAGSAFSSLSSIGGQVEKQFGNIWSGLSGLVGNERMEEYFKSEGKKAQKEAKIGGYKVSGFLNKNAEKLFEKMVEDNDSYQDYLSEMKRRQESGDKGLHLTDIFDTDQLRYNFIPALADSLGVTISSLIATRGMSVVPRVFAMTGISTDLESRMEASQKFQQLKDNGISDEEALRQADNVYTRNIVEISTTNFLENVILTSLIGKSSGTLVKRFLQRTAEISGGAFLNVAEERGQNYIQDTAFLKEFGLDRYKDMFKVMTEFKFDRADFEALVIGFGTQGSVYMSAKARDIHKKIKEKKGKKVADKVIEQAKEIAEENGKIAKEKISDIVSEEKKKQVKEEIKKETGKQKVSDEEVIDTIITEKTEVLDESITDLENLTEKNDKAKESIRNDLEAITKAQDLLEQGAIKEEVIYALSETLSIDKAQEIVNSTIAEMEKTQKPENVPEVTEKFDSIESEISDLQRQVKEAKKGSQEKATLKRALEEKRKEQRGKTKFEKKEGEADSVISYIDKSGKKVFTRLSKEELVEVKDEVKNIPQATDGVSQIHLDATTGAFRSSVESGESIELSRDDFVKGHSQVGGIKIFKQKTKDVKKESKIKKEKTKKTEKGTQKEQAEKTKIEYIEKKTGYKVVSNVKDLYTIEDKSGREFKVILNIEDSKEKWHENIKRAVKFNKKYSKGVAKIIGESDVALDRSIVKDGKITDKEIKKVFNKVKGKIPYTTGKYKFETIDEAVAFIEENKDKNRFSNVLREDFVVSDLTKEHLFGDNRTEKDKLRRAKLLGYAMEIVEDTGILVAKDNKTNKDITYYDILGKTRDNETIIIRTKLSEKNKNGKLLFTVSDISSGSPVPTTPSSGRRLGRLTALDTTTSLAKEKGIVKSEKRTKEIYKDIRLPEKDLKLLYQIDVNMDMLANGGVDFVSIGDGKSKRVSRNGGLTLSNIFETKTSYERAKKGYDKFYEILQSGNFTIEEVIDKLKGKDKQIMTDLFNNIDSTRLGEKVIKPVVKTNDLGDILKEWGGSKHDGSWGVESPKEDLKDVVVTNNNQDVGEKIGGAKKDQWAEEKTEILADISDEDILVTPMAKLLPNFNYTKLLNEGKNEDFVKMYIMARGQLGTKPRRHGVSRWVENVKDIRIAGAEMLNSDSSSVLNKTPEIDVTFELFSRYDYLNDKDIQKTSVKSIGIGWGNTERGKPSKKQYVLDFNGKSYVGFHYIFAETNDDFFTQFNEKFENFGLHELHKKGDDDLKIKKIFRDYLTIYQMRATKEFKIFYKNGAKEFEFKDSFKTLEEAKNAKLKEENYTKWEKEYIEMTNFDKNSFRIQDSTAHKTDKYRSGNITSEQFMSDFGFRGVEFGNWVNQKERQARLNGAYDSFMEMAEILKIPARALSLNGELAFAFGSRGKKGSSASYNPGKVVIQLTKKNGAGTVAHEWFHSVDNYLMRRQGHKNLFATGGLNDKYKTSERYNRKEVANALENLMNVIYKETDIYKRSKGADKLQGKTYYSIPTEMGARAFESYIKDKLDQQGIKNNFLVALERVENISERIRETYPYAIEGEIKQVSDAMDNLFHNALKVEDPEGSAILYKEQEQKTQQEYTESFLSDLKKRFNLEFDVEYVNTILSKTGKEAWGISYDNTIAILKNLTDTTEHHEAVHLTLANLDKIEAFKGFDRNDLIDRAGGEEKLAVGFENYIVDQVKPSNNVLRKFFKKLKKLLLQFAKAIKLTKGDIIKDYYDTLLFAENVSGEMTKLENRGIVKSFIENDILDLRNATGIISQDAKNKDISKLHQEAQSGEIMEKSKRYSGKVKTMEETRDNMQRQYDRSKDNRTKKTLDKEIAKLDVKIGVLKDKEDSRGLMFKLKEEKHYRNLKSKHNSIAKKQELVEQKLEKQKKLLKHQLGLREIKEENLKLILQGDFSSLARNVTQEGDLSEAGLKKAKVLGINAKEAQKKITEYFKLKNEYKEIKNYSIKNRKQIAELNKQDKAVEEKKNETKRRLIFANTALTEIQKSIATAQRFNRKFVDSVESERRRKVREIVALSKIAGRTTEEVIEKALMSDSVDYNNMNETEFVDFVSDLAFKSRQGINKEFEKIGLMRLLQEKEFKRIDNLRTALGLPKPEKMSLVQIKKFKRLLGTFRDGDVFLPTTLMKKLETTELAGSKTYREVEERFGYSEAEIKGITQESGYDRLPDYNLKRKSIFHKMLVDSKHDEFIEASKKHLGNRLVFDKLLTKARKSRAEEQGILQNVIDWFIPTDKKIVDYLEIDKTNTQMVLDFKKEMTKEEVEAGDWLIAYFVEQKEYLEKFAEMTTRFGTENYVTHIRKGLLESLKDKDLKTGIKQMFSGVTDEKQMADILADMPNVIGYHKFFANTLFRTGEMINTNNLGKIFEQYDSGIQRKKALDRFIPKIMAYASLIDGYKETTKEGIVKERALKPFVVEYLNKSKGRLPKGLFDQGGFADKTFTIINTFIYVKFLAFSLLGNIITPVGEFIGLMSNTSHYEKYKMITRLTKLFGNKKLWDNVLGFTGESPAENLRNATSNDIIDKTQTLAFMGFSYARFSINKMFLLAKATNQEMELGEFTKQRLSELEIEMSATRIVKDTQSIQGGAVILKPFRTFLTWAFPVIFSTATHIAETTKLLSKKEGWTTETLRNEDVVKLGRAIEMALFTWVLIQMLRPDDDDEEKTTYTWQDKAQRKLYNELQLLTQSLTIGISFDQNGKMRSPSIVISQLMDFGTALNQIGEQYQKDGYGYERGDDKGKRKLKNFFNPVATKQFNIGVDREKRNKRDRLLKEAIENNSFNALEIAEQTEREWHENRKDDTVWKKKQIREVEVEYRLKKEYNTEEYNNIKTILKDGKNNIEKAKSLALYSQENDFDNIRKLVKTLWRDKNLTPLKDMTHQGVSSKLWKLYKIELKKLGYK